MTAYSILLFIHIFSAILGLGPGFYLIQTVKSAQTMTELRHAYSIRRRLHIFVMIGGTLLLITGLLMGWLKPSLFYEWWYIASLILFLLALAIGPLILAPLAKPIKVILETAQNEEIPDEYFRFARVLFRYERLESIIFLIIIALMILKP